MENVYVTLQEAANLEGLKYYGMLTRLHRNPEQYNIEYRSRKIGNGKDEVMVAVSSLSPKARRAWRAAQKADGRD
ncbi:transposase, partial [Butyricicoccus sp. 1XD8-22]